ncbi:uncharacterized protein LOC131882380 [Tigriopus californicus]|uniref:uncharacterized protein LOC131882380 n=1 Tax=Tigriopus californicus TaxID=6832 RepID=UPI0027DAB1C2|nr:uncharacterized protein LOC131882380 [Tigriopus californicus]
MDKKREKKPGLALVFESGQRLSIPEVLSLEVKPLAYVQEESAVTDVRTPKCDVLPKCHSFMLALKQFPNKMERLTSACRQITPQLRNWVPKFFKGECIDPFQPASHVMMPSYIMLTGALQANVNYQELILHCSTTREFHFQHLSRLDQGQVQDLLRPCQTKANRISWMTLGLAVLMLILILAILVCLLSSIPKRDKKAKPIGYTWTCEVRKTDPESQIEEEIMVADQLPPPATVNPVPSFQTFQTSS